MNLHRGVGSNLILGAGGGGGGELIESSGTTGGLEGSPVLDSTDVPSSAPKQSMPEVHGLVGSSALESTSALFSAPTQPILEVLFTKPVRTFVSSSSHHVHKACMSDLHCMYE